MSTVPPPRTEEGAPGVLSYIAESVRELARDQSRGFEGIRKELAELPRIYLSRVDADRRFDELRVDVGALEASLQRAETTRAERERQAAAERTTTRRWLVTTALATLGACSGVLFGVINHFS